MKKVLLLVSQFRLNTLQNIFFILQCIFVFLLVNSTISSMAYSGYVGKYVGFDGDTTLFLSDAVENALGDELQPDKFRELVDKIAAVDGVTGVGYQTEGVLYSGKNNEIIVDAFALNEEMIKIRYPITQGHWFDEEEDLDDSTMRVILGGDIANQYKVGEEIVMYGYKFIDGSWQQVPLTAKVIGKMRNPAFGIDLNYGSTQPDYINMFMPYENLVLTDDAEMLSEMRCPAVSLLVFTDGTTDIQAVKEKLSVFGQAIDFNEVQKIYDKQIIFLLSNKLPTTSIMILGILFGVIGITYLSIYQNMKALSVYYVYGMSRRGCALVNVTLDAAMLLFSLAISVGLYFVPGVKDYLFRSSLMGIGNFIFCFAFIAVVLGIAYIISRNFAKKSPLLTLRRFE